MKKIIIILLLLLTLSATSFADVTSGGNDLVTTEEDFCDPVIKEVITDNRSELVKNDAKHTNELIKPPVTTVGPTEEDANNPCFKAPETSIADLIGTGIVSMADTIADLASSLLDSIMDALSGLLGLGGGIDVCQTVVDTATDATGSEIPIDRLADQYLRTYDPVKLKNKGTSTVRTTTLNFTRKTGNSITSSVLSQ